MKVTIKLDMTGDTQGVDKFLQQLSDDMFDYVAQHGYVLKSVNRDITFDEGETSPASMQPAPTEPVVTEMQPAQEVPVMEKLKKLQEKYSKKKESTKENKQLTCKKCNKKLFSKAEESSKLCIDCYEKENKSESTKEKLTQLVEKVVGNKEMQALPKRKFTHPNGKVVEYNLEKDNMEKKDADKFANDLETVGGKDCQVVKSGLKYAVYSHTESIQGKKEDFKSDRIQQLKMLIIKHKKKELPFSPNTMYKTREDKIVDMERELKSLESEKESTKSKLAKIKEANEPKLVDALAQPKESEDKQTLAQIWEEAQAKNEHRLNAINFFTTTATAQHYPDDEVQAFLKKNVWDKETKTPLNN